MVGVQALSDDLLVEIFKQLDTETIIRSASQVCERWRNISAQIPIEITISNCQEGIDKDYMQALKHCFVVGIDFKAHCTQVRSHGRNFECEVGRAFEVLATLGLPSVRKLRIYCGNTIPFCIDPLRALSLLGAAHLHGKLESLTIDGLPQQFARSAGKELALAIPRVQPNLQVLRIEGLPLMRSPPVEWAAFASLRELYLVDCKFATYFSISPGAVTTPTTSAATQQQVIDPLWDSLGQTLQVLELSGLPKGEDCPPAMCGRGSGTYAQAPVSSATRVHLPLRPRATGAH